MNNAVTDISPRGRIAFALSRAFREANIHIVAVSMTARSPRPLTLSHPLGNLVLGIVSAVVRVVIMVMVSVRAVGASGVSGVSGSSRRRRRIAALRASDNDLLVLCGDFLVAVVPVGARDGLWHLVALDGGVGAAGWIVLPLHVGLAVDGSLAADRHGVVCGLVQLGGISEKTVVEVKCSKRWLDV